MDWKTLEREISALSRKIDCKPNIIIGITRGGIIPARLLSSQLKVERLHCISVVRAGSARVVVTKISEDIRGKTVLLVDDMLETGKGLEVARAYLEEMGARVKTACLYIMPMTEIYPDYCLKQVDSVVQFPWE